MAEETMEAFGPHEFVNALVFSKEPVATLQQFLLDTRGHERADYYSGLAAVEIAKKIMETPESSRSDLYARLLALCIVHPAAIDGPHVFGTVFGGLSGPAKRSIGALMLLLREPLAEQAADFLVGNIHYFTHSGKREVTYHELMRALRRPALPLENGTAVTEKETLLARKIITGIARNDYGSVQTIAYHLIRWLPHEAAQELLVSIAQARLTDRPNTYMLASMLSKEFREPSLHRKWAPQSREMKAVRESVCATMVKMAGVGDMANDYVSSEFAMLLGTDAMGTVADLLVQDSIVELGSRQGSGKPIITELFKLLPAFGTHEMAKGLLKLITQNNHADVEEVMNDFARKWKNSRPMRETVLEMRIHIKAAKPAAEHENKALQLMRRLHLLPAGKATRLNAK